MKTNTDITIYHHTLDEETKGYIWNREYISAVMWQDSQGSTFNQGFTEANSVSVFIPIKQAAGVELGIGDIIVRGNLDLEIKSQKDIPDDSRSFNIKVIKNRDFGSSFMQHIEIVGE